MKKILICAFAVLLFLLCGISCGVPSSTPQKEPDTTPDTTLSPAPKEAESPTTSLETPSPTPPPLYNPPRVPERLVAVDEFAQSEYLLLVRCITSTYSAEQNPLFSYALLGEGVSSIEDGRDLYARLNRPYEKAAPYENSPFLQNWPEEFKNSVEGKKQQNSIIANLYTRHIIYFSQDGSQLLCLSRSYFNEPEYGWDLLYEVYNRRERYDSLPVDYSSLGSEGEKPYTAISPPRYEATDVFLQQYYDRMWCMWMDDPMRSHPYVKEYESVSLGPLFSPDGKYYAYRSPDPEERFSLSNKDYEYIYNPDLLPFGKQEYGYYIRNVETGDTVFYESDSEITATICWVQKDAIDAILAENEGKGPVD